MLRLENKFTKIIYKILKLKKTKSMNLKISQVSNWDSLNNLQLLIFLEKEFKIKFNENELSSFTSLKKIFNILKKKLNAKNQKFK
jgi:acyl carrier protein